MQPGRKILNLRCDRKISQQELARACDITPSALSKIEAGINSPRAHIIWKIAKHLGVTVEYLLDEDMPYPYTGYSYRQDLYSGNLDPDEWLKERITREEKAFLEALRESNRVAREVAMAIPEVSVEQLRVIHFLVHNSRVQHPTAAQLDQLHQVFAPPAPEKPGPVQRPTTTRRKTARKKKR